MSQEQLGQRPAMGPALLDVNVLIALLDQRHVQHEQAHGWFAAAQANGWATCPLTQNAVLRILGQPRYPNSPGPTHRHLPAGPGGAPRRAAGELRSPPELRGGGRRP
jgi:hypothetical protein